MSFSLDVKQELSKISNLANKESVKCELVGYLITSNISMQKNKIKFSTESQYNINRFGKLLSNLGYADYTISIKAAKYNILVDIQILNNILNVNDCFNIQKEIIWSYIGNELIEKSFLRGVFLGSGSINNPERQYHLEMIIKQKENAEIILKILEKYNINFKVLERNNNFVIYTKDGEEISNFLALIGANSAVLKFEQIRVYRDMKNKVNRQVNCETANLNKVVNTAVKQINNINYLKEKNEFDKLPETLKEIAEIRLKRPEASLEELGKLLTNPIGKSGVNHRLKRIEEIVKELKKCEK